MSLIECVPNVSEGRRADVVAAMADAIASRTRRTAARSLLRRVAQPLGVHHGRRRGWRSRTRSWRSSSAPWPTSTCARTAASTRGSARSTSCRSSRSRARRWPTASRWRGKSAPRSPSASRCPVYLYEEASANPARRNLEDIRRGEFEGLAAKMAAAGMGAGLRPAHAASRPPAPRSSARGCRSSPTTSTWPPTGSTSRRRSRPPSATAAAASAS